MRCSGHLPELRWPELCAGLDPTALSRVAPLKVNRNPSGAASRRHVPTSVSGPQQDVGDAPASKAMKSVPGSVIISADDDNLIRWGRSLSHPVAGGAVGQ